MRHDIFDVFLLISCAFASWKGGAPERIIAILLFAGDLLSLATLLFRTGQFRHEEYGLFAVDAAILVVLVLIALRSTRWWPLFLAGMQLDAVLTHLIHIVAPGVIPAAYLDATALWSYPMLLFLMLGTFRHRSRMKTHGADPSWKRQRPYTPTTG